MPLMIGLVSTLANGAELYDFINPTYSDSVDMQGGTSVLYNYWGRTQSQPTDRYYSVYYSSKPAQLFYVGGELHYSIEYNYYESHFPSGVTRHDKSSVFRWGVYFIFALSLVFISTKIVKEVGV